MKFSRVITAFLVIVIVICGALILSGKIGNKDGTTNVISETSETTATDSASNVGGSTDSAGTSNTAVNGGNGVMNASGGQDVANVTNSSGTQGVSPETGLSGSQVGSGVAGGAGSTVSTAKVTVANLTKDDAHMVEFLGAVKANDQIKVFASAAGQVQAVYAQEGETVNAGDPLFLIGGLNGTKAVAQVQLEMAQRNYLAAQKGLKITKDGNAAGLRAAQLQLESARHQADGYNLDMQVFDQNIGAAQNGLFYLQDSYNATVNKNGLDLEKTQNGIDDLSNSIDNLERQKAELEQTGGQEAAIAELDKTIEGLYASIETARIGYETLEQAKVLTENQILGQIAATESQGKVLYLNQLSLGSKLGLTGDYTDAVKLAEAGLGAAGIKNEASLVQAQTQLELAKSNLELAQMQVDSLVVKAPIKGSMGEILAREGDLVSQQSMLTQVFGLSDYELRVAVDLDSADMIVAGSMAEVEIRGRSFKLPVKNVGVSADAATRLVNVTVVLPKVKFRTNQTLKVKLPLAAGATIAGDGAGAGQKDIVYAPLDAVIIGTEEQYVYVSENGKAVKKNIVMGEVRGDRVQVLEGLSATDSVIVDGAKSLTSGQDIVLQ